MSHIDPCTASGSSPGEMNSHARLLLQTHEPTLWKPTRFEPTCNELDGRLKVSKRWVYQTSKSSSPKSAAHNPPRSVLAIRLDRRVCVAPSAGACGMTVQSLVVTKRAVPVFLTSDVPPLLVKGTAVECLIATPSRLWGVFHSDVGKRVKHHDKIAVIVNVRPNLRQIEIDNSRFWIPRRAEDRRSFAEDHRKRRVKTIFRAPSWTGTPRPEAETVKLRSVTEFDLRTIKLLMAGGGRSSRFGSGGMSDYDKEQLELQRKKQRKRDLLTVLNSSRSRMSSAMFNAVFDVVVDGTEVGKAASARGLKPRSLSVTVMRLRQRMDDLSNAA